MFPRPKAFLGLKCSLIALWAGLVPVGLNAARATFQSDADYLIDTWETEDGLPENSATAMAQSPDGYLWFGSFDGLVRFDGIKFTVFNPANTPGLPSGGIVNLHLDRRGWLWVSTYRGLALRQGEQWRTLGTNDGWTGDYARSFAERANGDLLITSFNGKVFEFTGGRLTPLPPPSGRAGVGYLGFADTTGNWWVVQQWFVGSWNGENWTAPASITNLFSSIKGGGIARAGGLWLLGDRELWSYHPGREAARVALAESPGHPWSITEDSRGNVWIASFDKGLSRVLPSGEIRRWTTTNGLSYNGTRFVFEDREQNLWIGTSGGGLQRFKPRRFQSYGTEAGLADRNVTSVSPDGAGGVWLATYNKGMFRCSRGVVTHVPLPPERNTLDVVNSVLTDRTGRTWFGTWGQGICVSDSNGFRRVPPQETGGFNILALFEDSRGRIWAGGERHTSVGEGNTFRPLQPEPGWSVSGVRCFAEDREGVVWLSNLERVFRYEQDRFVEARDDGAALRNIACIKTDADGTVWLGGHGAALLCWRSGRFTRVLLEMREPASGISGLLEDDAGYFWMASSRGVLRAARNDLLASANGRPGRVECQVLDLSDGLPSVECAGNRQPVCARDAAGRLWFATLKGAAMIDPKALRLNTVPPPVKIELLAYHSPRPDAANAVGTRTLLSAPFPETILLPAGGRRIEIHYAALSFTAPEKARFQVKIEPGDADWQDAGGRRAAHYHDFRPGKYLFRVRAANNDGVWNETGATLAFVVRPFIWQTRWFQFVVALLLAASGGGTVWWWARARLRQAAERETTAREMRDLAGRLITAQEEERTRLARELHDDLSQSLALLSVDLELFGQKPLSAPDEINARMRELSSQVKSLSSEVHRLSHELHPAKLEQLGLAAAVRGFCKELSAAHEMAIHFEAGDLPRALPDDVALCLYRVAQEALQNVVKHSGATSAQVTLTVKDSEIRLNVRDDGSGFDAGSLPGNGSLGLVSMRERARLVRGRLTVESKEGEGTRVEVRVPLPSSD